MKLEHIGICFGVPCATNFAKLNNGILRFNRNYTVFMWMWALLTVPVHMCINMYVFVYICYREYVNVCVRVYVCVCVCARVHAFFLFSIGCFHVCSVYVQEVYSQWVKWQIKHETEQMEIKKKRNAMIKRITFFSVCKFHFFPYFFLLYEGMS